MPDRVMARMEWMGRSGEEDKRWEVAKKRVAVWIKKYIFFGSLLLGSSPGRSALQSAE